MSNDNESIAENSRGWLMRIGMINNQRRYTGSYNAIPNYTFPPLGSAISRLIASLSHRRISTRTPSSIPANCAHTLGDKFAAVASLKGIFPGTFVQFVLSLAKRDVATQDLVGLQWWCLFGLVNSTTPKNGNYVPEKLLNLLLTSYFNNLPKSCVYFRSRQIFFNKAVQAKSKMMQIR